MNASAGDAATPTQWARLTLAPDGTITAVDDTFLRWTSRDAADLIGIAPFSSLLSAGGRIYHETHLAPLLLLQGEVHEIAFDVTRADGTLLAVLVHAVLRRDEDGTPAQIEVTVVDATVRRGYERELQRARRDAERAEREVRSIAEALQRSLLHRTELATDLVTVATRYVPAVDSLEVGGDWHDAFLVDGDRAVGVSVGDVVGKGISAACAMGQARSALRALARSGSGPGPVLVELDRFVQTVPDAFASTAVYAELDLTTLELRYTAAGHPPPVVVRSDGTTELLWDGRSTPVGAARPDQPRSEGSTQLRRGDRVVLYTDGLCERRDRAPDDGFALVASTAASLRDVPLEAAADALMASMLNHDDLRDDTCLLLLEVRPDAG